MPTTNLSITSASYNAGTGELTCAVTAAAPLYIYELILVSFSSLGAPVGMVRPGTAAHPVLRTIYVDSTNSVFTTNAPFTLAVTYNTPSYQVTDVQVQPPFFARVAQANMPADPVLDLNPEQAALFVKQVLEAALKWFDSSPPGRGADVKNSAYNGQERPSASY